MMPQRENLEKLLADMLALETAEKLGLVKLLDEARLQTIRAHTRQTSQQLLYDFEKSLIIKDVKEIIVKDVRIALLRRGRYAQAIEWTMNVTGFIAAATLAAGQFVFTSPMNVDAIRATYWIALVMIIANFLGSILLRYVDRSFNDLN